jgi:alanine or glycine:cation symporter, AGCS family
MVLQVTKKAQRKAGLDPVFNPKKLGIGNAEEWEKEKELQAV